MTSISPEPDREIDPRVYYAAERTLLAWLRTGLAMMGFGFVVARFGLFLHELAAVEHAPASQGGGLSVWLGAALVAWGVIVTMWATANHLKDLARLKRRERVFPKRVSLGVVLAAALAVIGIAMAVYLLLTAQ